MMHGDLTDCRAQPAHGLTHGQAVAAICRVQQFAFDVGLAERLVEHNRLVVRPCIGIYIR